MKKHILTILISCSILSLSAQKTWFKFVPGWQAQKSIIIRDTIWTFGTGAFGPMDNFLAINKINLTGKILSSDSFIYRKLYNDSTGYSNYYWSTINPIFFNNVVIIPTNLYFFKPKGLEFDSKLFSFPKWKKLSLNIKQDTNTTTIQCNKTINNKNYGILQEIIKNSKSDNVAYFQLINFSDSNYKVVKKQPKGSNSIYGHIPYYENIHADNQNPANLFLQILDRWDFAGDPNQFEGVIQKIDTTGKLIWESRPVGDQDTINTSYFNLVQLPNGNILCSWLDYYYRPWKDKDYPWQFASTNKKSTVWFAEIDYQTGKKLWTKNIKQYLEWKRGSFSYADVNYITDNLLVEDGVVWCGYHPQFKPFPQNWTKTPFLLKTDFKGNPLWYRDYNLWSNDSTDKGFTPYSFIRTPDKGFLLTGEYMRRWGVPSDTTQPMGVFQTAALLKLDSNGCFTPGCNATDNIIKIKAPENICKIYPNPANNFIIIEYPKSHSNDWEISILDINGKIVFESKVPLSQIPTSNLPNGTYLIQLKNKIYQHHETHQIIIQH